MNTENMMEKYETPKSEVILISPYGSVMAVSGGVDIEDGGND